MQLQVAGPEGSGRVVKRPVALCDFGSCGNCNFDFTSPRRDTMDCARTPDGSRTWQSRSTQLSPATLRWLPGGPPSMTSAGGGSLPEVIAARDNGAMPLYSDEAIVLRTHKLAEASLWVRSTIASSLYRGMAPLSLAAMTSGSDPPPADVMLGGPPGSHLRVAGDSWVDRLCHVRDPSGVLAQSMVSRRGDVKSKLQFPHDPKSQSATGRFTTRPEPSGPATCSCTSGFWDLP